MSNSRTPKRERENTPVDSAGFPCTRKGLLDRYVTSKITFEKCKEALDLSGEGLLINPNKTRVAEIEYRRTFDKVDHFTNKLSPENKNKFFVDADRLKRSDIRDYTIYVQPKA